MVDLAYGVQKSILIAGEFIGQYICLRANSKTSPSLIQEFNMAATKLDKVLYTAHAHTTGGREGRSVTDDGLLDVKLTPPKLMGGAGNATNPEQLFAAGYSACFLGALKHVASLKKVTVPAATFIDASVDIGPIPAGFGIAARLAISLPGLDRAVAQELVDAAHQVCPYSNATRGNIEVRLTLI
jgi:Ohr subfamily peroxiredoxin